MLVYRNQLPENMALDDTIEALKTQKIEYPLQYGYACVGRIEKVGAKVDSNNIGRTVFAFLPHGTHHICQLGATIPVPDEISAKAAVFLANMETAVSLIQDGGPAIGERAVVIGQGIVGLLVSKILSEFPLSALYAIDSLDKRRLLASEVGVQKTFSPSSNSDITALHEKLCTRSSMGGADIVFETSGSPEALDLAIDLTAYSGRIVVGSWYGTKRWPINLGEKFHRNRITIRSSQVSNIAPELTGRWDKARRFAVAWNMLKKCDTERLISHCIPFLDASSAYHLLDTTPRDAMQIVLEYPD